MPQETKEKKSTLDTSDGHCFTLEIPAIIALVILAALWLLRAHQRDQKLRKEGSELCRKSLEK